MCDLEAGGNQCFELIVGNDGKHTSVSISTDRP